MFYQHYGAPKQEECSSYAERLAEFSVSCQSGWHKHQGNYKYWPSLWDTLHRRRNTLSEHTF